MEGGGSTVSSRKNPLRASTSTCLPSSLISVTGESQIPAPLQLCTYVAEFSILVFLRHLSLTQMISVCVRESEDTALLLLREIYDNLGVAFEQPQQ